MTNYKKTLVILPLLLALGIVMVLATQQQMTLQEMLEALHDFKEVVTFKLTGG